MARRRSIGNAADNGGSAVDFIKAMQSPDTEFGVTAETKANYESKISELESKVSGLEEQLRLLRQEHSEMFVTERNTAERLELRDRDVETAYQHRDAAVARAEKAEERLRLQTPLFLHLMQGNQ